MNPKKDDLDVYDIPRHHPGVRKINPLLYAIYNPNAIDSDDPPYTLSAAELANCLEFGAAARKGNPSDTPPLIYDLLATWFNDPAWEDKRRLPQFIDGKWAVQGSLPHFDDFGIQKEHRGDTIKRDAIENNPFKRRYVIDAMFQVARMKEQEERAQAGSHKRPYAQVGRHTAGPSNNNNTNGGRPLSKKRRRDKKDTGSRAKQTDPNDAEEGPMDEDNIPEEGEKRTEPAEEVAA